MIIRMKKRKRKMKLHTRFKLDPSSSLEEPRLVTIFFVALAASVFCHCSIASVIPQVNQDETKEATTTGNSFKVIEAANNSTNHHPKISASQAEDEAGGSESGISGLDELNQALDDDLLAMESSRLLTIGKPASPQHATPPYASNLTNQPPLTTTNNQSSEHNFPTLIYKTSQLHNETFPARLGQIYRPPPPVFVRHPPSRQELRLLYPAHPDTSDRLRHQSQQVSRLAPFSTWFASHHGAHQQPLFFLPPRAGRPVIASSNPAPSSWPNWHPLNVVSLPNNNKTSRTEPTIEQQQQQQQQQQQVQHIDNTTSPEVEGSVDGKVSLANTTSSSLNQTAHLGTKNETEVIEKKFPSTIATATDEDEFERLQRPLSMGHYQRTNTANMSWAQLLRQATEGNVMESLMVTNRTMVSLLCDTNDMLIRLRFRHPFRGSIATNLDRRQSCRLQGTGGQYYEMRISLHECGTRQESPRLFINNIQIQFHQSPSALNLVEDELKTIICSYPIRPRAPPPPDLQAPPGSSGLPERIVELTSSQQPSPSEPAKLVYYEPLLLISGLVLLALTVLGLITSAYIFTTNRRNSGNSGRLRSSGRSSSSLSTFSSRLYRKAPAQTANLYISPPLIGMSQKVGSSNIKRYGYKSPLAAATLTPADLASRSMSRKRGRATKAKALVSTVSVNPSGDASSDSLADKHDRSSVTTIEIPYVGKARQDESPTSQPSPKPQHSETKLPVTTSDSNELAIVAASKPNAAPDERETGQLQQSRDATMDRRQKPKRLSKMADSSNQKEATRESKEVAVGDVPQPFGSLRATLTTPLEFRRLQEIARLFDEILIENHVNRGDDRTIVYNTTRLSPSKYKTRILDAMDEEERRLMSHLLQEDEIFRSLVVESTDSETFQRKLRNNSAYSANFKPEAWQLLEEILLDPDISTDYAYSSQTLPPKADSSSKKARSKSQSHSKRFKATTSSPSVDKNRSPKGTKGRRSRLVGPAAEEAEVLDESILGERETKMASEQRRSPARDRVGTIRSESEIQWPTSPSGDSLESSESRVYFVMYERHLFVT